MSGALDRAAPGSPLDFSGVIASLSPHFFCVVSRDRVVRAMQEGRDRLARGWARCTAARGRSGESCDADSLRACRWSSTGAMWTPSADDNAVNNALEILTLCARSLGFASLHGFDGRAATTQADVLALYDRAIAALEAQR